MAKDEDVEKSAMGFLLVIGMVPFAVAFRAFVAARLWAWFVVPFGAPAVGLGHAYGLMSIVTICTVRRGWREKHTESEWDFVVSVAMWGFAGPALVLLLGWLASLVMAAGY